MNQKPIYLNFFLHLIALSASLTLIGCGGSESMSLEADDRLRLHADLDMELVVNGKSVDVKQCILTERLVHKGVEFESGRTYGWAGKAYFIEFSYEGDWIDTVDNYELFDADGQRLDGWNYSRHSQVFVAGSKDSKLKFVSLSMERIPLLAIQATQELRLTVPKE